jgi:hypothetical protein
MNYCLQALWRSGGSLPAESQRIPIPKGPTRRGQLLRGMVGKHRVSAAFSESQRFGQVPPPLCRHFLCKILTRQAICRPWLPFTDPPELCKRLIARSG